MAVNASADLYNRLDHASHIYSPEEMAGFRASGAWKDLILADLLDLHVRIRPNEIAIVDETSRITWAQLANRVNRLAAAFVDAGLKPGEFVGIQLPNRIEFVEAYLAIQRAGLRALTMMSIYREKDVEFMLNKTKASAYVTLDSHRKFNYVEMAAKLMDSVPSLRHVIIVGEPAPGMHSYESFMRSEDVSSGAFRHLRPDPDSLSKVSFTSGTTGFPKGVAHTHNTDMVPPLLTAKALGLTHETPIWMPSPICHATGLAFGVYDSLLCGAKLVLQDVWNPVRALEMISAERAVFTVSATPFIAEILEVGNLHDYDLTSFRYFGSGGARIPTTLVERAKEEMGCYLLRVFGQAEAPLHTLNLPGDPWEKLLTRDGKAFDEVKVRIVDPETRTQELPAGEVGEYATWGPHVFLGYYDNTEASWEAKDQDRWYYSADLCLKDEDGFVLYVDRIKDIVNRGGIKISALEVENMLAQHPGVQNAAIVAVPDDRLGERACAFIVPRPGHEVTLQSLGAFLDSQGVTKQKWPEQLEIVPQLPFTATGKIQKNLLRDSLEARIKDA
jgi:non-ribosomal peptide synthetase component E (peptide arylation enzyme)